jgi:hypothetical protein
MSICSPRQTCKVIPPHTHKPTQIPTHSHTPSHGLITHTDLYTPIVPGSRHAHRLHAQPHVFSGHLYPHSGPDALRQQAGFSPFHTKCFLKKVYSISRPQSSLSPQRGFLGLFFPFSYSSPGPRPLILCFTTPPHPDASQ